MIANMHRKKYMGWCRLCSTLTTARMVTFPTTATRYIESKWMESQICTDSCSEMPVNWKKLEAKQTL